MSRGGDAYGAAVDASKMSGPSFDAAVMSESAGAAVVELTLTDRAAGSFPLPGQRPAWAHVLLDAAETPLPKRPHELVWLVADRLKCVRLLELERYPDAAPTSANAPRMRVRVEFTTATLLGTLDDVPAKKAVPRLCAGGASWKSGRRHRPFADWTFARGPAIAPARKVPTKEFLLLEELASRSPLDLAALSNFLRLEHVAWPGELFARHVATATDEQRDALVTMALDHVAWSDFQALVSVRTDPRVVECLAAGILDRPTGATQRMECAQHLALLGPDLPEVARTALRAAVEIALAPAGALAHAPPHSKHLVLFAAARALQDDACRTALRALSDDEKRALWLESAPSLRALLEADELGLPPRPAAREADASQ